MGGGENRMSYKPTSRQSDSQTVGQTEYRDKLDVEEMKTKGSGFRLGDCNYLGEHTFWSGQNTAVWPRGSKQEVGSGNPLIESQHRVRCSSTDL